MLVVFCQPSRNIATITRALEHGWCVARIRTHETIDSNVDDHEAMIWVMNSALNAMKSTISVSIDVLISTISCHFSTEGGKKRRFSLATELSSGLSSYHHPVISTDTCACYHQEMSTRRHITTSTHALSHG